MQSSLEKLRKFFRLEAENKYANTAVIGGLAKILDFWEAEARNEGVSEEIIQLVSSRLRDYHRLTPASRAETLKGVWKRIQGQGDAPLPEPVYQQETVPQPGGHEASPAEEPRPAPKARPQPESAPAPSRRPAPARSSAYAGAQSAQTPIALQASLTVLQGVGPRNAEALKKLGLYTLGDMLYNFPRRYDDYSRLKPIRSLVYGEVVTVIGQVQNLYERKARGGKMSVIECIITDGTGGLRITWFNQPWLMNRLKEGMPIAVAGKIEQYLGRLVMNSPEWEPVETEHLRTNRIVPVYPLTANITQNWLRKQMEQVVRFWAPRLSDPLPETIRASAELLPLGEAIQQAHFPDSQETLKAARERLAFDEIFYLQMGVLRQKREYQSVVGRIFDVPEDWLNERIAALPFPLTGAQKRALDDIIVDIGSGRPMNRLIQGDVGSGKTVVAALAAMMITRAGAQAAIMAPTAILAEQHFKNFSRFLLTEGLLSEGQIRLLTGDTANGEREAIHAGLASGEVKVLIGTHALLEDPVQFKDLQLVVIDEQHRFGVEQRAALRRKGEHPHLLVMTATPIPRSLALTLYGDLDVSVMDEMPAGRKPVSTFVLTPQERERAYSLIRSQIRAGGQAFIVYPLIEESEKMEDLKAAVDDHERLSKEIFPDLNLGLLHGKMRPDEKDRIMAEFRDRKYHILVSTTVIEVGVDVPNATVMLIEGANRFGLAQLHQLRGRVGRGGGEAFCLLIPDRADSAENERLRAMTETNDGFRLAELDLQQRGPGEFLGTAQAGHVTSLKMASLTDIGLIEKARKHAAELFARDPQLTQPEHALLAEAFARFWGQGKGDVS
ncbi:MAG: ATP-dependent DNA helicase RecG [Anaerolineales bacterium]|nr:ATP-dependent DNA helicase RecG [Anaerolineales bacterium]MDW8276720.1 ATP-dependent DNA helicase RecG [Anaerolineales bacterium]